MSHWLTRFDPEDGEPYGTVCHCLIDRDHTQAEWQEVFESDVGDDDA